MSSTAFLGGLLAGAFAAALAFNYHPLFPSQDTSQQKEKSEQTDETSKDKSEEKNKSEQKEKSEQKDKGSTKKASKKKASACITNCPDDWPLRPLGPWPNDQLPQ
jgi:hypothetical protein